MKSTSVILIFLCWITGIIRSQDDCMRSVDSLEKKFKNEKNDTQRINLLCNEAYVYLTYSRYDDSRKTINRVLVLEKANPWPKGRANAYHIKAILAFYKGDYDASLKYNNTALAYFKSKKNKQAMARSLGNIAVIYHSKGDYYQGLKYHLKALRYEEELKNEAGIADSYNNIGVMYENLGEINKALVYQKKSLAIRLKLNDIRGIQSNYTNLGNLYQYKNKYDSALIFHSKSLEMARAAQDENGVAISMANLGGVFHETGRYRESISYYKRAAALSEKIGNQRILTEVLGDMGLNCIMRNIMDSALFYCNHSLDLAIKMQSPELEMQAVSFLHKIYKKQENWKDAHDAYYRYVTLRDSIMGDEKKSEMTRLELTHEFKLKEEKRKLWMQAESRRKNLVLYSVTSGLCLSVLFGFYVWRSLRKNRKMNEIIRQQKTLVEIKQKETIDSINYAQRLQHAILTPEDEIKKSFPDSFLLYKPKDIVAGDFYFFEKTPTHIFYAAADCTGHGVPGAMVSIVCANALTRCVKEFGLTDPGQILDKTRKLVLDTFAKSGEEVKDGMDISLVTLTYRERNDSPERNKLTPYSTHSFSALTWAGANNPVWYIQNNELKEIKGDKQPVGMSENPRPFTTHTLPPSLSALFLFTDGYADQFGGEKGKKFKYINLQRLLSENSKQDFNSAKFILNTEFEKWKGDLEQVDDVCIIGIRI